MQIDQEINDNLKRVSTWKRIFFILVFGAIMGVVRILLWLIVLLQVVYSLLTGKVNQNVLGFSKKMSAYIYHMWLFMTFNTEELPFPFLSWNETESMGLPDDKPETTGNK
jgi:hypothetical protein